MRDLISIQEHFVSKSTQASTGGIRGLKTIFYREFLQRYKSSLNEQDYQSTLKTECVRSVKVNLEKCKNNSHEVAGNNFVEFNALRSEINETARKFWKLLNICHLLPIQLYLGVSSLLSGCTRLPKSPYKNTEGKKRKFQNFSKLPVFRTFLTSTNAFRILSGQTVKNLADDMTTLITSLCRIFLLNRDQPPPPPFYFFVNHCTIDSVSTLFATLFHHQNPLFLEQFCWYPK